MIQLGIIAALPAEARCLTGQGGKALRTLTSPQRIADDVSLMICGVGAEQATLAAAQLIQQGAGALLSWGCAGALSNALHSGDLLLPQTIKSAASGVLYVNKQWHAALSDYLAGRLADKYRPNTGTLISSADMLTGPVEKKTLFQSSDAVAVDMESAAIATAAAEAEIPLLVIRAIADDAATSIPAYIHKAMDRHGNISLTSLLSLAATHPGTWLQLLRLGRSFSAARATLSDIASIAGPNFLLCQDRGKNHG